MFVDNENQFSTGGTAGQSVAAFAAGTTALGNVIDSGPLGGQNVPGTANAGRDFGMGYPAWLYFLVVTGISQAANTTDIQLVSSAAANLSSPNVMLDLTGGAIAITGSKFATSGTAVRVAMPRAGIGGTTGWLRFLGINFILVTTAFTTGVINAFLSRDIQDNLLYQAGFVVA
jgi:hypothetical protein